MDGFQNSANPISRAAESWHTIYTLPLQGGTGSSAAISTNGLSPGEDFRRYYWLDPFTIIVETSDPVHVKVKINTYIDKDKTGLPFLVQSKLDGAWTWADDQVALFTTTQVIPTAKLIYIFGVLQLTLWSCYNPDRWN
jgi:hypothetical protein